MVGKHRVQIGDNTVRYDFVVSRNITIIRGDSGTGKTTLYNLIQEMNQKKNSGITWNCDCDCYALTDFDWEDVIESDESYGYDRRCDKKERQGKFLYGFLYAIWASLY